MTIGRQKHHLRSPNVLLRAVAVSDNRFKLVAVGGRPCLPRLFQQNVEHLGRLSFA
jgi:hypothetical protein